MASLDHEQHQKMNEDLINKNKALEEKLQDSTYSDLLRDDTNTTEIVLVRHGQTEWNVIHKLQGQGDSNLTDVGKMGALKVGGKLLFLHQNNRQIDCVYASPLKRAKQTAQIIMKQFKNCNKLEINYDNRIMERNFGDFQGKTMDGIKNNQPEIYNVLHSNIEYRPPNGESLLDVTNRVTRFLAEIATKHYGKRILVISHGGVLAAIFNYILIGRCHADRAFHCKNCAINIIQRDPKRGKWYVTLLGDDNYGDYQCIKQNTDIELHARRDMTTLFVGFVVGCLIGYSAFKARR
eukprot:21348_1